MPKLIGIIQIILSLVIVMALAVGCAVSSSTPATEQEGVEEHETAKKPSYVPVLPSIEYECSKPHGLYLATTLPW